MIRPIVRLQTAHFVSFLPARRAEGGGRRAQREREMVSVVEALNGPATCYVGSTHYHHLSTC